MKKWQRVFVEKDNMEADSWTVRERDVFFDALRRYGMDFHVISIAVSSRSKQECENFYRRCRLRLGPDGYLPSESERALNTERRKQTFVW